MSIAVASPSSEPFSLLHPNVFNFCGKIGVTFLIKDIDTVFFTLGFPFSDFEIYYTKLSMDTPSYSIAYNKFLSIYEIQDSSFEAIHSITISSFLSSLINIPFISNKRNYYEGAFLFDLARFFSSAELQEGVTYNQVIQHPRFRTIPLLGYKRAQQLLFRKKNQEGDYCNVFNLL